MFRMDGKGYFLYSFFIIIIEFWFMFCCLFYLKKLNIIIYVFMICFITI
jgi:hypothetical protein